MVKVINGETKNDLAGLRFTSSGKPEAEAVVTRELGIIRDVLLDEFPVIEGLLLIGSMGCGDGVVLVREPAPIVISDYDLVAITRLQLDRLKFRRTLKAITEKIGHTNFHVTICAKKKLSRLKPSINSYALKYGSRLLWGSQAISDLIPAVEQPRIVNDHVGFIPSAPWQLLTSLIDYVPLAGGGPEIWRNYNITKILIFALTNLLLAKDRFAVRVRQRIDLFEQVYPEEKDLLEHFKWAEVARQNPGEITGQSNFFTAREVYLDSVASFMSHKHKRQFKDWPEFIRYYTWNRNTLLKRITTWQRDDRLLLKDRLYLDSGLFMLLAARLEDGIDDTLFKHAQKLSARTLGRQVYNFSWEELTYQAVDTWLKNWMATGF